MEIHQHSPERIVDWRIDGRRPESDHQAPRDIRHAHEGELSSGSYSLHGEAKCWPHVRHCQRANRRMPNCPEYIRPVDLEQLRSVGGFASYAGEKTSRPGHAEPKTCAAAIEEESALPAGGLRFPQRSRSQVNCHNLFSLLACFGRSDDTFNPMTWHSLDAMRSERVIADQCCRRSSCPGWQDPLCASWLNRLVAWCVGVSGGQD